MLYCYNKYVIWVNKPKIVRFCNKINTTIIGGASKLISYFIKKYKPTHIITFADRRYSIGDLYLKLGFKQFLDTIVNSLQHKSLSCYPVAFHFEHNLVIINRFN